MKSQCLISFGSNLGDRHALIADAAKAVASLPMVNGMQASRLFETPPIGGPTGQEPFLNAVAAFDTEASAREVLGCLQALETDLGRKRRQRWGARAIDLDVVLHGELVGGGTGLIVPHPRYTARQFVLQPACDVAAHYRDPRFGWTLERLARHIDQGTPSLALVGGDQAIREELCTRLTSQFGVTTFAAKPFAERMRVVGNAPARVTHEHAKTPPVPRVDEASRGDAGKGQVESVICGVKAHEGPWVSAFLPRLPQLTSPETDSVRVPRLVARMQSTTDQTRWPAPHQLWPAGWRWPEYRLEIDDTDWAVSELASALSSMRCPVEPVTTDGAWW
ncbi:MAG: 2-amino-4-hydroxy-6-hydroxymethyldihydropteridine diphosphokinase [Rubripirellula sp.]|nr:2-amino-4-hydroxy-6-hydroxymethyldihydropteridine diphosphokinase [Rhodopirellula sp.]MCH1440713.1 2-amino-4-hydroxy-6-hydroxymethyldihydropteridine diphosphokinase [Rubripirellula sp.]OUX04461.1 MAG: 2-amino-4-hydroxy-6-hydroxymethyldihydropteridine diphosphokinase [Planctomycetaceae bacterium TMED240]